LTGGSVIGTGRMLNIVCTSATLAADGTSCTVAIPAITDVNAWSVMVTDRTAATNYRFNVFCLIPPFRVQVKSSPKWTTACVDVVTSGQHTINRVYDVVAIKK
jgi:hypothetical protein